MLKGTIPSEIGKLTSLKTLRAGMSFVVSIDLAFEHVTNIFRWSYNARSFYLNRCLFVAANNSLTGTIPREIGEMESLEVLDLCEFEILVVFCSLTCILLSSFLLIDSLIRFCFHYLLFRNHVHHSL